MPMGASPEIVGTGGPGVADALGVSTEPVMSLAAAGDIIGDCSIDPRGTTEPAGSSASEPDTRDARWSLSTELLARGVPNGASIALSRRLESKALMVSREVSARLARDTGGGPMGGGGTEGTSSVEDCRMNRDTRRSSPEGGGGGGTDGPWPIRVDSVVFCL